MKDKSVDVDVAVIGAAVVEPPDWSVTSVVRANSVAVAVVELL